MKGIWFEEIFYFSFLVFFMLFLNYLVRFYKSVRVYEKFLLKSSLLNDYLIEEPRSLFEENYNMIIYELIKNNSHKEIENKQERKLQKVLVYKFVH